MEELFKPKYFAPVNLAYYPTALEIFILSFFSIFPNIYFLYKALTNDRFTKRPMLKMTVIILSIEYMIASIHAVATALIYLVPYYFDLPISVMGCAWIRSFFYITLQIVFSTPFIIYIDRHFKIIRNKGCNPTILATIALIINLPAIVFHFGHKFDSHPVYIADEVCTYQHFSTNPYIHKSQYLMMFTLVAAPIFAGLMNVYTFYALHAQNKVASQRRIKEQKQLFIALTVQSVFPVFSYGPSVATGILYSIGKFYFQKDLILFHVAKTSESWPIWKYLNAIFYSSMGVCVLLSVIFIKDIREMILIDMRLMKPELATKTPITVITVSANMNLNSQRRVSNKVPSVKKANHTVM
uniref:G_PROTEIN_RECEP_F1_2 domain-containing protein n=1 Tax=Rhabditophanes sp. KR3021 TaxID=114890 RepID=A0AC35TXV4_9BILA